MPFGKQADGFWHWECEQEYDKTAGLVFWFLMGIMLIPGAVIAIFLSDRHFEHILTDLMVFGEVIVVYALIAFFMWFTNHKKITTYRYIANEEYFIRESIEGKNHVQKPKVLFDTVETLRPLRRLGRIDIVLMTRPGIQERILSVYTKKEDFDQIWFFFMQRCQQAEIEQTMEVNGKIVVVPKKKSAEKKYSGRSSVYFALAVIVGVLAVPFTFAWGGRGLHIDRFTGTGTATIIRYEDVYITDNSGYKYEAIIEIDGKTMNYRRNIRSKNRPHWKVGQQLPVTYNIDNPKELVIGSTPEEYAKWFQTLKYVIIAMWIAFVFFTVMAIRSRIRAGAEKNKRLLRERINETKTR